MKLEFYKIPGVSRLDQVVFFFRGWLCFVVAISSFLTETFIIIFLQLPEALLEIRSAAFRLSCQTKHVRTTATVMNISNLISTVQYLYLCSTRCGAVWSCFIYIPDILARLT
jgi:hypothetical protein